MDIRRSGNGDEIDVLRLRLESLNMAFERVVTRPTFEVPGAYEPTKRAAVITFDDSYEIDILINMLEEFKKVSREHCGAFVYRPPRKTLSELTNLLKEGCDE